MRALREQEEQGFSRRKFLASTSALGAAASLFGIQPVASSEPPPETKKIRVLHSPGICLVPQYLAEALLKLEGFSEVEYVGDEHTNGFDDLAADKADVHINDAPGALPVLDAAKPFVLLAGIHGGCYELFGTRQITGIRDLKGKTVAVYTLGKGSHLIVATMLAYVGINPNDVHWLPGTKDSSAMQLFVEGKADAFIGFPPDPQELRAKNVGHVILDTSQDRPWSRYFCCMVGASRRFTEKNPIATKRALRAFLKATDICAQDPARAARYVVEKGYEARYQVAYEVLTQLSYRRWRETSPEDTLRFYALRLHEVGMIKTNPQKLIDRGTDWRFLNQLRKELKV